MALFSAVTSLVLIFLSVSSPSVQANSIPAVQCTALMTNMAACLSYVTIGSKVDKPESACCLGLKKILDTNATCLCEGLKNSGSMGIKLNMTKATTLPAACNLTAPPLSSCGSNVTTPPHAKAPTPVPVPVAAPKPTPPKPTPVSAPAPSPTANHGSSLIPGSGWSIVISVALVILLSLN